jgi:hypothetical protein
VKSGLTLTSTRRGRVRVDTRHGCLESELPDEITLHIILRDGLSQGAGSGSRSNHGEARKEFFAEETPSEDKDEAEKRRRNAAKEIRDKEDRDNLKTNSGNS